MVSRGRERRETATMLERLRVTPADPDLRVGALSGRNQQKGASPASGCGRRPALLIADEPTRGVDVGAEFGIYELLVELAANGMGDPPDLLGDRRADRALTPGGGDGAGPQRWPTSAPRKCAEADILHAAFGNDVESRGAGAPA